MLKEPKRIIAEEPTAQEYSFGQNKGKFTSSVSSRTLVRVLLLQMGHNTHDCISIETPPFILKEYKIHINVMKFLRKHIVQ